MGADRILLVEDDKEIREGVEIFLRSQGYQVFQAADGLEGLKLLEQEEVQLAIVDVMMPRMDGITMVVKLREMYDFPVIFLSAKSEEVDKILGLNMGADDYITKPFTPMELLARVNSQLRRYSEIYGTPEPPTGGKLQDSPPGRFGNQRGHGGGDGGRQAGKADAHRVQDSSAVGAESRAGYSRRMKSMSGFGMSGPVNTDTVMVHIRNIREKIEVNPKEPKYVKVVWGVGYKIEKQA